MEKLCKAAKEDMLAGKSLAIVEIIEHRGSTPRGAGARMLVRDDGSTVDTIGGGALEIMGAEAGLRALRTGRAEVIPFSLSGNDVADTKMICGGSGTLFVAPLSPEDLPVVEMAIAALGDGRRAWLATASKDGAAHTVFIDENNEIIGPGQLTEAQKDGLIACAGQGGSIQNGEGELYCVRMLSQKPALLLFGGGHVGKETAALCHHLGFSLTVIDDREEFANPERFPFARCLVAADPESLPPLTVGEETYILIMTRGHLQDQVWLRWVMMLPVLPRYVGMIGSRRKIGMIVDYLTQAGVEQDRIRQLHSPVGLAIGAETPEEIAVSIAAQLIMVRSEAK